MVGLWLVTMIQVGLWSDYGWNVVELWLDFFGLRMIGVCQWLEHGWSIVGLWLGYG